MTLFDDREQGEEITFTRHNEAEFKRKARRNVLLGTWAANRLGLSGQALAAEVALIVDIGMFEAHADDAILAKIHHAFVHAGIVIDELEIRRKMAEFDKTIRNSVQDDAVRPNSTT